jgi:hypothetical protein
VQALELSVWLADIQRIVFDTSVLDEDWRVGLYGIRPGSHVGFWLQHELLGPVVRSTLRRSMRGFPTWRVPWRT